MEWFLRGVNNNKCLLAQMGAGCRASSAATLGANGTRPMAAIASRYGRCKPRPGPYHTRLGGNYGTGAARKGRNTWASS